MQRFRAAVPLPGSIAARCDIDAVIIFHRHSLGFFCIAGAIKSVPLVDPIAVQLNQQNIIAPRMSMQRRCIAGTQPVLIAISGDIQVAAVVYRQASCRIPVARPIESMPFISGIDNQGVARVVVSHLKTDLVFCAQDKADRHGNTPSVDLLPGHRGRFSQFALPGRQVKLQGAGFDVHRKIVTEMYLGRIGAGGDDIGALGKTGAAHLIEQANTGPYIRISYTF